ncbi:alpha/beta fold hydrolase [Dietzia sp. 179-F 9C3 NHS]|uniref:alpha/beta fold hydrolase n=1 Tax=Dietzia sp. 179-F 9C3 NHS TaxID=3374295 RepID=UPI0038793620
MTDDAIRYADAPGGRLAYRELGDPGAPAVLFLHGSGPGVTGWRNFGGSVPGFAEHFRCLVLESPGFGISDDRGGHPVVDAREAALELLDALGVERTHVVGNSMGAIVGAGLAGLHPERVDRLVGIGGLGTTLFSPGPAEGIRLLTAFLAAPDRENLRRWLESMVYDRGLVDDDMLAQRWEQVSAPGVIEAMRRLYDPAAIASVASGEVSFDLAAISAPTLLFWGRDDRVTPVDMMILPMRMVPHAEIHILPNCGHWVMVERKDEFERQTVEFLRRPNRADGSPAAE